MLKAVDIRPVWQDIVPGILSIWESLPWKDWIPEDIYAACLTGGAAVLVKEDVHPKDAFMVVRMDTTDSAKNLFIWIAWCPDEEGAASIYTDLDEIAASNGCTAIEFVTGEQKLAEFAGKFGYDKVMYEVRKKIDPITPEEESTDADV